jgi:hypothetical protein
MPTEVLVEGLTGDLIIVDIARVEVGDLIFLDGHLVRRVLIPPRDIRDGDYFTYMVEPLDASRHGTFVAATEQHFHAFTNTPGCLPEGDELATFEAVGEAWCHLADELGRDWDADDDECGDDDDARLAVDGRYLTAHTAAHIATCPGWVHVPGATPTQLGRNYSVVACTDDHDATAVAS